MKWVGEEKEGLEVEWGSSRMVHLGLERMKLRGLIVVGEVGEVGEDRVEVEGAVAEEVEGVDRKGDFGSRMWFHLSFANGIPASQTFILKLEPLAKSGQKTYSGSLSKVQNKSTQIA